VVQRAVVNGGDEGGAGKGRAQVFQQGATRVVVQALGRLVEQQQAGVTQVGLGDAEPAPLAAGEPLAAWAELRGQVDLPGQNGDLHGLTQLIDRGVRAGQAEVIRDGAAEQLAVLIHERHAGDEVLVAQCVRVGPADPDRAGHRLQRARQYPQQRRFACTRGTRQHGKAAPGQVELVDPQRWFVSHAGDKPAERDVTAGPGTAFLSLRRRRRRVSGRLTGPQPGHLVEPPPRGEGLARGGAGRGK